MELGKHLFLVARAEEPGTSFSCPNPVVECFLAPLCSFKENAPNPVTRTALREFSCGVRYVKVPVYGFYDTSAYVVFSDLVVYYTCPSVTLSKWHSCTRFCVASSTGKSRVVARKVPHKLFSFVVSAAPPGSSFKTSAFTEAHCVVVPLKVVNHGDM